MRNNDWKDRLGMVYSTSPDFKYNTGGEEKAETLPKEKQVLRVSLDKRNRGGKTVTLITGFRGKEEDLTALGKYLKVKCGAGGSAKDAEIIIQGDVRRKVSDLLIQAGYGKVKVIE
jgi:translation initiation factor 1